MPAAVSLTRPDATEYSAAVADYIRLVPSDDVLSLLAAQAHDLSNLVGKLSDEQALVRHAPYTWSIKQVVGHLGDCDRVFGYRAMRLARHDATPLAGFDENSYMQYADFDRWPIGELLSEFTLERQSHLLMFRHFDAEAWLHRGIANNHPMTARAVAFVMAGHTQHHLAILHKRLGG